MAATMDATGFNESFFSKNADAMLSSRGSDPAMLLKQLGVRPSPYKTLTYKTVTYKTVTPSHI